MLLIDLIPDLTEIQGLLSLIVSSAKFSSIQFNSGQLYNKLMVQYIEVQNYTFQQKQHILLMSDVGCDQN